MGHPASPTDGLLRIRYRERPGGSRRSNMQTGQRGHWCKVGAGYATSRFTRSTSSTVWYDNSFTGCLNKRWGPLAARVTPFVRKPRQRSAQWQSRRQVTKADVEEPFAPDKSFPRSSVTSIKVPESESITFHSISTTAPKSFLRLESVVFARLRRWKGHSGEFRFTGLRGAA